MQRVETAEFSIIGDPGLSQVRIFGTSIGMRRVPETLVSPQMTVWTRDTEGGAPADVVAKQMAGLGKIVERREIAHAGMRGAFAKAKDRLADENNRKIDWYRLRALLVSADGANWYQATAMCSADDLPEIEAAFFRTLDSIVVKQSEGSAAEAHRAMDDAIDTAIDGLKTMLDAAATAHQAREAVADAEAARAPVESVEARFDDALAAAGLSEKRDALRRLALPTLSLAETAPAEPGVTGRSRIGGGPDLPEGMDWPRDSSGFHFNFIAQVDLAALPDRPEPLPESGLLAFFSGTDFVEWRVIHMPAGTPLVAHALPADAEALSSRALGMVVWDSALRRLVLSTPQYGDLTAAADADGRLQFSRNGMPVIALASEYEISPAPQWLRIDPALSVPSDYDVYDAIGLDDPYDFTQAIRDAFRIGRSPRHQMFGVAGIRDFDEIREEAAKHARLSGWTDLTDAQDWFLLLNISSGGKADFCFGDAGYLLFLANRNDMRRGDFSRVFAMMDSS